jgi:hypothetical protein
LAGESCGPLGSPSTARVVSNTIVASLMRCRAWKPLCQTLFALRDSYGDGMSLIGNGALCQTVLSVHKTKPCRLSDMGHAQQCRSCGTRVRDDLVDHSFFGFAAGCQQAREAVQSSPKE